MNKQQIISVVTKLVTIGLAFLAGRGYITQDQVDAGNAAIAQVVDIVAQGGLVIATIVSIYRSIKTHQSPK